MMQVSITLKKHKNQLKKQSTSIFLLKINMLSLKFVTPYQPHLFGLELLLFYYNSL